MTRGTRFISILLASACTTGGSDGNSGSGTGSTSGVATAGTSASATAGTSAGSGSGSATGTTGTSGSTSDTGTGDTGTGGAAACYPDGIYGKCSESPGCQCLQGANVYQVCTKSCQMDADCGDATSFPGANPGCFPLNPGSQEKICALICQQDEDCPCGLICTPSGVPGANLCAELQ